MSSPVTFSITLVHCLWIPNLQIMGSDHCPISLILRDKTAETFPTPEGAGNLRKSTNQKVEQCKRVF